MAQYTANENLYKWSTSDTKQTTITEMALNADKIDVKLNDHAAQLASIPNQTYITEKAKQTDLDKTNGNHSKYVKSKILTDKPQRIHYHLFDSFIRTDSLTSLGNAETNNTAWSTTTTAGNTIVWGINGNSAYVVSRLNGGGAGLAYQETNESDVLLEVDLSGVTTSSGDGGLAFRILDVDNFLYACVQGNNNSVTLYKYVNGVKTEIYRNFDYSKINDGKLSVLLKGNKIEVYLDGFLMIRRYDSFNVTATKHGLFSTGGWLGYRWNNFSVKPVGVVPFYLNETFDVPISKWYWGIESPGQSYSQTYSTSIKENGNSSLRIELHKDDIDVASSRRCEIKLPSHDTSLSEHWYGVSIFLPNGGAEDYALDTSAELLVQWHNTPDISIGESDVQPQLGLMTQNGNYQIVQRWDSGRVTTVPIEQSDGHWAQVDLGSYENDKGKWVQWVFHVKWGYLDCHDPICELFKDGVLVYSRKGANTYNDQKGVYPKMGIYKWDWKSGSPSLLTSRVVYYDNYWMR